MLENHRIESIEPHGIKDRFPRYVGRNAKGKPQAYGGGMQLRIVTTNQGAKGWASSNTPDEQVTPLIGEKLSDLFDLATGTHERAYGLDLVLHDLIGRILNKPAYQLLGAKSSPHVPIYTGAIYFDDLEPEDSPRGVPGVVESCQQDYDAGYRAFKLKIGRGFKWMEPDAGLQRDIDVVRAVREAFPGCKILVDANDSYTCESFIRFLSGVSDCDLYWIEEPFAENETDLKKLKAHMAKISCNALIAEGEGRTEHADPPTPYGGYTMRHVNRLYELAEKGLVDVFLLDLGIVGFTRWRNIMPKLIDANVLASPHTWCWPIRPRYVAQLGAGVGNVVCVEGIPGETSDLDYSNYKIVDGDMIVPDLPGFAIPLMTNK